MSSAPALELREVVQTFYQAGSAIEVLKGASLSVSPGEMVALVGPSRRGQVDPAADRGPPGTPARRRGRHRGRALRPPAGPAQNQAAAASGWASSISSITC